MAVRKRSKGKPVMVIEIDGELQEPIRRLSKKVRLVPTRVVNQVVREALLRMRYLKDEDDLPGAMIPK